MYALKRTIFNFIIDNCYVYYTNTLIFVYIYMNM